MYFVMFFRAVEITGNMQESQENDDVKQLGTLQSANRDFNFTLTVSSQILNCQVFQKHKKTKFFVI